MNSPKFMKKPLWTDIFRPVAVLFVISAVIAAALSGANKLTADRIAGLSEQQERESMQYLFPGAEFNKESYDTEPADPVSSFNFFRAEINGELEGYIFSTSDKGYGGSVSVMTAITADGKIKAVKILDVSNETPGLGQNAANKEFYGQLNGLSAETEVVLKKISADSDKNEITSVTGATITSGAVKDAVNTAIEQYKLISNTENGDNEK